MDEQADLEQKEVLVSVTLFRSVIMQDRYKYVFQNILRNFQYE